MPVIIKIITLGTNYKVEAVKSVGWYLLFLRPSLTVKVRSEKAMSTGGLLGRWVRVRGWHGVIVTFTDPFLSDIKQSESWVTIVTSHTRESQSRWGGWTLPGCRRAEVRERDERGCRVSVERSKRGTRALGCEWRMKMLINYCIATWVYSKGGRLQTDMGETGWCNSMS